MMNRDQLSYQFGRFFHYQVHNILFAVTSFNIVEMAIKFSELNPYGAINYAAAGYGAYFGLIYLSGKKEYKRHLSDLENKDPADFPLENVDRIIIADEDTLAELLGRTVLKEKVEWGTVLRSHTEGTAAVIDEILNSYEAEKKDYIHIRKKDSLCIRAAKARYDGYNGAQHFHPGADGGGNYSINNNDRAVMRNNSLDLLTFNFRGKPEVIGYNKRFTYIPEERDCKSRLVRASPKDILRYLER